jgi:V/A-type H+-transporting ATPase subunit C
LSDFDYGNARLRAMRSRLLSRRTLEALTELGSVQGLLTALTNTAYRDAVEAALVQLTDIACLAEAVRNDLVATLGKVQAFYSGTANELAKLVLLRYDVHNVKTLLRGLAGRMPADEIIDSTLPIGELRPADMVELARAANWRIAIDLLATWRLPVAKPLLELRPGQRGQNGGLEPLEMEVALDRWYFETALAGAGDTVLRDAVAVEADVTNILTTLRLVGATGLATILRERFGVDNVEVLFVGPGYIPVALLAKAAHQESILAAVATLSATAYSVTLNGALEAYTASNRLSVFERALTQGQLERAIGLFTRDPLGIGVLLGYVALKTNEVANLRAIAQGLQIGENPDRIRRELIVVD